jgi:NhaA family Na+:H+ antiporter
MDLHVPITERDHVRGAPNAPVVLVEYGDFDCPFCVQAYSVVRELLQRFDTKLGFVFRHNPRGELHPHARLAAQAAEAAALHGQFWPMHDLLFEHPKALEEADLMGYAASLGLDREAFAKDLHAASVRARVREDEVGGLHSAVVGTPTFFVNGTHFRDKPDAETLGAAIAAALSS